MSKLKEIMLSGLFVLFWITGGIVLPANAQNNDPSKALSPRYAERLLSTHYEYIAGQALKDIVPKDKYKLLIDVRIDNPEDLQAIATSNSYAPLPGTIRTQAEYSKNILLGQLESVTQSRNVLIILDPEYENSLGDEANLKELLTETIMGKLKLNLAGGTDKVNIRNIGISGDNPSNGRMPASVEAAPEPFNWIKFVSWAIALAGFLAFAFYLFRKYKKDENEQIAATAQTAMATEAGELSRTENSDSEINAEDGEDDDEDKEVIPENAPPQRDIQSEADPISPSLLILPTSANANDLVQSVTTLVGEYPKLTSEALQTFLDTYPNQTYRAGYLIELLGFEEALMLFKGVSQKHWKFIGQYMAEYPVSNENPIDLGEAAMLYRYLIARIVEHKGLESDMGVFAIEGYSANDLAKAIESEDDRFAAQFISGISDAMAEDILNSFTVSRRAKVLTALSTIDTIDPETINYIETTIQTKMSQDGVQPITISNEARIFSSLSSLSPYEEEKLFTQMAEADPGILMRSKRFRLYPEHLAQVRRSVLEEEFRSYPIESIAQMIKGLNEDVRNMIISSLTEKKAMVVEDMLVTIEQAPNGPESAAARRDFLDTLYDKYAQGGVEFIDTIFELAADSGQAA